MFSDQYIPKMAVIVYENSNKDINNNNKIYLERREIKNGQMGSGVPLSKKCVSDMMETIAIDKEDSSYRLHGAVPSNLLFLDFAPGDLRMVWYNPPQKRKCYFTEGTGIPDGELWVPGLVYAVKGNALKLYAFKGNKPKHKLYRAPFMNVGDGNVCLGNSKLKKPKDTTISLMMGYWEQMFWRSEFSHLLEGNSVSVNFATLTKKLIETGEKFPTDVLLPSNTNLKTLLR